MQMSEKNKKQMLLSKTQTYTVLIQQIQNKQKKKITARFKTLI